MQQLGHIVLMVILLAFSAFFSGSETAFFNLSRRQINLFKKSEHRLQRMAAGLLENPSRLLGCLLFGNMSVNVLFFAVSSVLTVRVGQAAGVTAATAVAVVNFTCLVLFGEVIPKSVTYANSKPLSALAAAPVYVCVKVFSPVVAVFRFLIEGPVLRLVLGPVKHPKPIGTREFRTLIEHIRKQGLITLHENKLLSETIELAHLRVRDAMCPRVDMTACDVTESPEKAQHLMLESSRTKLCVYRGSIDNIIGVVHLRELVLRAGKGLDKLVRQVHYVPEQKTVESLLEFFRRAHTDMAVVVDEYGGIAGSVRLEDIAEELLGPIEPGEAGVQIEPIGPLRYRLSGNVAIHDWADVFNIDPSQMKISTLAGLVTALLDKIPKPGDTVVINNVKFMVEKVRRNRIESVILTLEPIREDRQ